MIQKDRHVEFKTGGLSHWMQGLNSHSSSLQVYDSLLFSLRQKGTWCRTAAKSIWEGSAEKEISPPAISVTMQRLSSPLTWLKKVSLNPMMFPCFMYLRTSRSCSHPLHPRPCPLFLVGQSFQEEAGIIFIANVSSESTLWASKTCRRKACVKPKALIEKVHHFVYQRWAGCRLPGNFYWSKIVSTKSIYMYNMSRTWHPPK